MLIAIGLLVLAGDTVSGKLVGENVCQEEQRYMRDFSSTKIISTHLKIKIEKFLQTFFNNHTSNYAKFFKFLIT
jgi:hypothetical protein